MKYPPSIGWVILTDPSGKGPLISLDETLLKRTGKRSHIHLDFYYPNQNACAKRLVLLGARRYPWRYKSGDDFIVLEDPDGNLF